MAKLDPRHLRLYGPAFALHDVRDVEAHVRTLLDAYLRERGAHLDPAKYADALAYLVALCWRLSGLQGDGRTPRVEYAVHILITDRRTVGETRSETLEPFATRERAELAVAAWRSLHEAGYLTIVVSYGEQRPRGSYDPSFGLSFSTYSRRILTRRCVDWYRATFGDNRYGGNQKPVSLDQLVDEWEHRNDGSGAADSYLDHRGPGARLDFVDELNRHAYYDPFEEREASSVADKARAIDQGGTDRVAAAG